MDTGTLRRKRTAETSVRKDAALGLRAQKGGSVAVCVALDGGEPQVRLSTFIATASAGDRLAGEPYHLAAEMVRGGAARAAAAAAVAKGRKSQEQLAARQLAVLVNQLQTAGCKPQVAALLVNRCGWIADLLQYSLAFPDHPPVAEGLAVREALRAASARAGLEVLEMDEKSLHGMASKSLGLSAARMDTRLKDLGTEAGRPWRKEQKLACLAAWMAAAARL